MFRPPKYFDGKHIIICCVTKCDTGGIDSTGSADEVCCFSSHFLALGNGSSPPWPSHLHRKMDLVISTHVSSLSFCLLVSSQWGRHKLEQGWVWLAYRYPEGLWVVTLNQSQVGQPMSLRMLRLIIGSVKYFCLILGHISYKFEEFAMH